MNIFHKLTAGLKELFRRNKTESELHEELDAYVQNVADAKVQAGTTPEEALRAELNDVIALSLKRGAGWIYVTDRADGNPYDQPPSYWSLEGTQVAHQGVQAPYASFRPGSSDSNGNPLPSQVSFRWRAVNGTKWQIFLDTDRNGRTGYHGSGSGLAIGATT